MSIVYKSDLVNANSLASLDKLEGEINNSQSLEASISDFIASSQDKLKGNVWDLERKRLLLFIDVLHVRTSLLSDIMASIKSANNYFINYMSDYDVIDDSKLNDLLALRNSIKNIIDSLTENETEDSQSADIDSYYSELHNIDKEIEKIKELRNADIGSNNCLSNSFANLNNYKTNVEGIK